MLSLEIATVVKAVITTDLTKSLAPVILQQNINSK